MLLIKNKWIVLASFLVLPILLSEASGQIQSTKTGDFMGRSKCPKELKDCRCYRTKKKVDCSNLRLKTVPENIPSDTLTLDLRYNKISDISNSAFQNTPLLEELDLGGNPILTFGDETLLCLHNLTSLNLRHILTWTIDVLEESVFQALCYSHISYLQMGFTNFSLRSDSLKPLQNKSIVILEMTSNHNMCNLPDNAFSGLQVDSLSLDNCQCYEFNENAFQDFALTKLVLSKNRLWKFPSFKGIRGIKQTLQTINLCFNSISGLENHMFDGFTNLRTLMLSSNNLNYIHDYTFSGLPLLTTLLLDNNHIEYVTALSFISNSLKKLHLDHNPIKIRDRDANVFRNIATIEDVFLGPTRIPNTESENHLFANISTLRKLTLNNIHRIYTVNQFFLKGLYNLTDLNLDGNNIRSFQPGSLSDLVSLKSLHLVGNEISVINATFFPLHVLSNLHSFYAAGNPYECTCQLLWFLDWIHGNKGKVINFFWRNEYKCVSPPDMMGQPLRKLHLTADKCFSHHFSPGLMLVLSICAAELVVALTLSVIYRFRWSFRLKLFHLGNWWRAKHSKRETFSQNHSHYLFDLFVSHNVKDSDWVQQVLLPELEQKSQPPFKLCLYNRNWLVGHDIANCILESLSQSRKTLLLVTNAFTQSEWCQFELTMAQHKLIEMDNDNVVLAIMEDIQPINLTPRLVLMMKRKTYLKWTDNLSGQQLFWEKLKSLLRSDGLSLIHQVPSENDCNALFNSGS